jgi:16S rRNA (cytidine1402-2'-O)-methyltransferase
VKLLLVPTPIGNLEDITLRALRVLRECDHIFAEDTRETLKLLAHFSIDKSVSSYHQNNEHAILHGVIKKISSHNSCALVTDAGTPGISDPGFLLVRECLRNGIEVECLPGPNAFVPALVVSGLPCERFVFEGFLPHKKGRETRIKKIAACDVTSVLYESPHRLVKTLQQLITFCGGNRQCSVSRELSKKFEETVRGTLTEVLLHFTTHEPRGEFVMIVGGTSDHSALSEEIGE